MKLFRKNLAKKTKFHILGFVVICAIITGAALFLFNPQNTEAAWYSSNWAYRKQFVIDHTKVSGGADLSSFPMLVAINDAGLNSAQSTGNDILFTSSDGTTKLSHEIEKFTQGPGTLIAWVKIPTLSASTDTVIYMYWGNGSIASQQDATNVWDSNYKGVWHLNQGTATSRTDSTSNANTLSDNGSVTSGTYPNLDGYAIFSGSSQYLSRTHASQTGLGITGNITVEAWGNSDDITNASNNLLVSKDGSSGNTGYCLRAPNSKLQFRVSNDGTATTTVTGATTLSSNIWYHFVGVYDGSNLRVYLNGTQDNSTAYSSGIFATTANVNVGARNSSSNLWDGAIDEVRISNTNRSAGWIATEYANQSSPSTFYSAKTYEEKNAPVLYWKFDDATGSTAKDASANGNDGTLGASTAAPTWQNSENCVYNKCLKFDGSNDVVSRTYSADTELDPATLSFSVSTWFRHPTSVSGTDTILARSNGATSGIGYKLYMKSTGVVCFGIDDDATSFPEDEACSSASYADNKWHFLSGVKSGTSSITAYIDGVQVGQDATLSATGTLSGSSPTLYVGIDGDGTSNPWDGFIDEVKYYDYARSVSQIKSDYITKSTVDGSSATFGSGDASTKLSQGLVGYWKMDESSWATDCSTNSIIDSSGNANNGTACPNASAAAITTSGKFGNAGSFDGTNDYASMGSTYTVTNSSLSISYWLNPAAFPTSGYSNTIVGQRQVSGNSDADFGTSLDTAGNVGFYASTNGYATLTSCSSTKTIATSTWSLYTAVVDSKKSTVDIYINGVKEKTCSLAAQLLDNGSTSLRLGYQFDSGNEKFYNGKLDDVRIYNRTLADSEISALYDWGPGPVGYWKLDEKTGTSVADSSGNGYTGTVTGSASLTNGKYGGGTTINNSTNRIDMGDQSGLEVTNMTLEAWYYRTGTCGTFTDCNIITKGSSSFTGYALRVVSVSGSYKIKFAIKDSVQVTGATTLSTNQWYHIAATSDGTTVKVYLNGVLDGSASQTQTPSYSTETFKIGNGNDNNDLPAEGIIDEPRVYNYPRTAKQIISDMNAGHPSVGSPVGSATAWWSFDEGYSTTAHDKSINSNDLTLSSASWTSSGKFAKAWNGTGSVWLTRSDDDDFDFTASEDFSISTWFKSDSASNPASSQYLLSKGTITNTGTAGYAVYFNTSGNVIFGIKDDTAWGASSPNTPAPDDTATSTTDLYDNTWHHVVATKTGTSNIKIYIDGKLNASDTSIAATATLANSIALRVGDDDADSTNSFAGDLDEMKVYRYALSEDEVKLEYNQGKSQILGVGSTTSDTVTPDNSTARSYCVPGDSSTCNPPIGEWNFEEGSGTSAFDTSGNGNTGTLTNSPTRGRGKIGKGLEFSQSNSRYVLIPDANSIDNTGAMTIEVWVRPTSTDLDGTFADIVAKSDGTGGSVSYALSLVSSDSVSFYWANANNFEDWRTSGTTIFTPGQWYHIVATRNSALNSVSFYINGVAYSASNFATDNAPGGQTDDLAIGRTGNANQQYFDGDIDQVKLYDYERTQAQASWSYNRGAPVAWWKLDECTGSTANDSSGNANTGTITIGATSTYTSAGTCNSGTSTEAWNAGSTGKFNSALGFDGTDDYISVPSSSGLNPTAGFSLSVWAKPTSLTSAYQEMIFKGTTTSNSTRQYGIRISSGNRWEGICYIGTTAYAVTDTTTTPSLTNWTHVVYVRASNNSTQLLYVNGKRTAASSGATGSVNTTSNILALGRIGATSSEYYGGLLDDARVYNYALTEKQILNIYNEGFATRFGPNQ